MALTPQEQALLDSLTAKASEPSNEPKFDSVEKILEYLVRTSSKFTANPEDQQEMLSWLDSQINPSAASAANDGV
jgi:hypothetical protein